MKLIHAANFLSRRFSWVLFLSFILGVTVPGLEKVPTHTITVLVAMQIFCSCFKVEMADIREIRAGAVGGFYLVRFVLLPVLSFWIMMRLGISEAYTSAVFLMLVLPAGVSAPAFTAILGGNVSLALFLVVLSSLICPFVVPGLFHLFSGTTLNIEVGKMFITMALLVFLPILAHLPVRRSAAATNWIKTYHAALVIPMVAATIVLALAKQREFLLANWTTLVSTFLVSLLIFFVLYGVGWLCFLRAGQKAQTAIMLASGLNNISLGIVLSALYFEPDVAVFMVVANVSWAIAVIPIRKAIIYRQRITI